MSTSVDHELREELFSFTRAGPCIGCGTCTAVCPLPRENVLLPRLLLRHLNLGRTRDLLERSESIYSCLLCRLCEETCPAGVDISSCVRFLRGFANRHLDQLDKE